jgi:DNA-binding transcriptional regulator YiaG
VQNTTAELASARIAFAHTGGVNGSDLRSRRLRLGWSRDQLAHRIGVPADTLSEWEDEQAPIRCPNAVEQILGRSEEARQAEASTRS